MWMGGLCCLGFLGCVEGRGDRVIYQVLVLSEYFLKWEKLQSLLTQAFL